MSTQEFVLDLIDLLRWPAVVLTAAWLLSARR